MTTPSIPSPARPVVAPAAPEAARPRRRSRWLGALAAMVLAAMLIPVGRAHRAELATALREVSFAAVALAVSLRLAMLAAQAERWRVLLPAGARPGFGRLLLYHLVAGAANWIAPLRPGEAVRVGLLAREERIAWPAAAAAQGVEKAHEALGLLAFALPLAVGPLGRRVAWLRPAAAVLAAALAAVVLGLLGALAWRAGRRRAPRASPDGFTARLFQGAASLGDLRRSARAVLLTLAAYALEGAMVLAIASATGLRVGPAAAVLTLVAINAALLLPSAPGQIGAFEAAVVVALEAAGASGGAALAAALVLHGCHAMADLGGGSFAAFLLPAFRRRRHRRAAQAA